MWKLTLGAVGVALALAACASVSPATDAPAGDAAVATSDEFHPSDVALLGATGRPQLVEFFAFW